jgi:hypothetical protein
VNQSACWVEDYLIIRTIFILLEFLFLQVNVFIILVGYGDAVPCTNLGRVVIIINVIFGLVYNSLAINIVTGFLRLDYHEDLIDNYNSEIKFRKKHRASAYTFIQKILVEFAIYRREKNKKYYYKINCKNSGNQTE